MVIVDRFNWISGKGVTYASQRQQNHRPNTNVRLFLSFRENSYFRSSSNRKWNFVTLFVGFRSEASSGLHWDLVDGIFWELQISTKVPSQRSRNLSCQANWSLVDKLEKTRNKYDVWELTLRIITMNWWKLFHFVSSLSFVDCLYRRKISIEVWECECVLTVSIRNNIQVSLAIFGGYVPIFYGCEYQNREYQVQVYYICRGLGSTKFQCE